MQIGILGTGKMGQALIHGILARFGNDVTVCAYDKREELASVLGQRVVFADPAAWHTHVDSLDVVLLAVKPHDVSRCARLKTDIAGITGEKTTWISIAAGVTIATVADVLGKEKRICRVMPNTPALVGRGVCAYALNGACEAQDAEKVRGLLDAVGMSIQVKESHMNAITGLSGSGPAYVFLFMESLMEAGIGEGLDPATARSCAIETVRGAAELASRSEEHIAQLRQNVMSPAGTTVCGLQQLEKHGFKYAVTRAVSAAARRAQELGNE
jgi:pyrroline-5-carboxylate reductase